MGRKKNRIYRIIWNHKLYEDNNVYIDTQTLWTKEKAEIVLETSLKYYPDARIMDSIAGLPREEMVGVPWTSAPPDHPVYLDTSARTFFVKHRKDK